MPEFPRCDRGRDRDGQDQADTAGERADYFGGDEFGIEYLLRAGKIRGAGSKENKERERGAGIAEKQRIGH